MSSEPNQIVSNGFLIARLEKLLKNCKLLWLKNALYVES